MKTLRLQLAALFALTLVLTPAADAFAQVAGQSAHYVLQSDSLNFAGDRSSSGNYVVEDTAGEAGTGQSASASFGLQDAGYQGMQLDIVPPTQTLNLRATTLSSDEIELNWDAAEDDFGVGGYYIYRDGVRIGQSYSFPRDYIDTGLAQLTTYAYNVSAYDTTGNEGPRSATTTATTYAIGEPGGPPAEGYSELSLHDLKLSANDASVALSFKTDYGLGADIYWGTDAGYSQGHLYDGSFGLSHYFLMTSLKPGTDYLLRIVLTDKLGHTNSYENIRFRTATVAVSNLPPNATGFSAVPDADRVHIDLAWSLPNDSRVAGLRVVRSDKFYPASPSDGTVILDAKDGTFPTEFKDGGVKAGTQYYYAIFTRDLAGNYSSGAVADAKILLPGETAATSTPLENLPTAGSVDPKIAALGFGNFLFIQNGDSLPVNNNLVTIDGEKNLTVALKTFHLPNVLKTVAVTLTTPSTGSGQGASGTKSFTFILRLSADGTRYEATLAPLGVSGVYSAKIAVIDFQNKGLRKLTGTIVSLLSGESFLHAPLTPAEKQFFGWLIALVLIALGVVGYEERKRKSTSPLAPLLDVRRGEAQGSDLSQPSPQSNTLAGEDRRAARVRSWIKNLFMLVLLAGLVALPHVYAAVFNQEINYQGRLVQPGVGVAVPDGSYNMRFSLYASPTGGTPVWQETETGAGAVTVTKGLFSVMLGAVNPLSGVDFDQTLYLGVEIGGTTGSPQWDGEMTPRKPLGAVPAALVAKNVDGDYATSTNATSTNLFTQNFSLFQGANGQTLFTAKRATDVAPTGDFISYWNAAGDTPLFRVDNSGNIYAGGITNSGAFTVTSVSSPQFRVQYDASDEVTTAVDASGATIYGFAGSSPKASWVPQSNASDSFVFADASAIPVLSIDTLLKKVTVPNFEATNATTTNATSTNLFATNATFTNINSQGQTITNLLFTNATGTSATTTNFFSTDGVFTNLTGTSLLSSSAIITNATTTNFFSTTASSTNLFTSALGIGTNTVDSSALVDLTSTSKGFLAPRMTDVQRDAIVSPATGLLVYNTSGNEFDVYNGSTWTALGSGGGGSSQWTTSGSNIYYTTGNIGVGTNQPTSAKIVSINSNSTALPNSLGSMQASSTLRLGTANSALDFGTYGATGAQWIQASNPSSLGTSYPILLNPNSDSTGFVGVGTTAPSEKLDVEGTGATNIKVKSTGAFSAGLSLIPNNNAAGFSISASAAASPDLAIKNPSGTDVFHIANGGNVGIGTTNPTDSISTGGKILDITGAPGAGLKLHSTSSSGAEFSFDGGSNGNYIDAAGSSVLTNNDIIFRTGRTVSSYGVTEAMRIQASTGNVGIGTTNPGDKLEVAGALGLNSGGHWAITPGQGTANLGFYDYGASAYRMVIQTSTGNVGIGTTNPIGGKFVVSNAGAEGLEFTPGYLSGKSLIQSYNRSGGAYNAIDFSASQYNFLNGAGINAGYLAGTGNRCLKADSAGNIVAGSSDCATGGSGADNLGNSIATQNIQLSGFWLSNDGGSEGIRVDNSGNVGVGTGSPTNKFTIDGGALDFSGTTGNFSGSGSGIYQSATNKLTFVTAGSQRVSIDASGNVGIGSSSPSTLLAVEGSNSTDVAATIKNTFTSGGNSRYATLALSGNNGSIQGIFRADAAGLGPAGVASVILGATTNQALSFITNNANRMLIDTSGNVGIGTSTPTSQLSVECSASGSFCGSYIQNTAGTAASTVTRLGIGQTLSAATALILQFDHSNGNALILNRKTSTGTLDLDTTGGGIRIDNAGLVGVGTTTTSDLNGNVALNVQGAANSDIIGATDGTAKFGIYINHGSSTGNQTLVGTVTNHSMAFITNDTNRMLIDTSGHVGIGTTTPSSELTIARIGASRYHTELDGANIYIDDFSGTSAFSIGTPTGSDDNVQLTTAGTPRLFVANGGNIGIGTTNPRTMLDIKGPTTTDGAGLILSSSASPTYYWEAHRDNSATGNLFFDESYNGVLTNKVTFQSNTGNVGIGITNPSRLLSIQGTSPSMELINTSSSNKSWRIEEGGNNLSIVESGVANQVTFSAGGGIQVNSLIGTGNRCLKADSAGNIVAGTSDCATGGSGADNLGNSIATQNIQLNGHWLSGDGGNEGIQVDSSGNVGVGTAAPATNLEVHSTTSSVLRISGADGNSQQLQFGGATAPTQAYLYSYYNGGSPYFSIYNNSIEAVHISSTGNVGIGTTAPGQKLAVEGSGTADEDVARFNNQADFSSRIWLRNSAQSAYIGNSGSTADSIMGTGGLSQAFFMGVANNSPIQFFNGVTKSVKMTIDSSGNVGIGTTTPSYALEVAGSATNKIAAGAPVAGTGRGLFYAFDTTGTNTVNIDSAGATYFNGGNVGIGITNPGLPLTISHTDATVNSSSIMWNGTVGGGLLLKNPTDTTNAVTGILLTGGSGGNADAGIGMVQETANSLGGLAFYTGGLGRSSTVPERLRIDSAGNVGINTTNPGAMLQVGSPASAATDGAIRISGPDGNSQQLQFGGATAPTQAYLYSYYNGGSPYFSIYNNAVEAVHIDSTGKVGIGTASPTAKLEVNGGIKISGVGNGLTFPDGTTITSNASAGTGITSATDLSFAADSDANGSGAMTFATHGSTRMSITNAGLVGIGAASPSNMLQVAGGITATGAIAADVANALSMDYVGTNYGRIYVNGPDTSTNGTLRFVTARSNGSNSLTPMVIDSTGNVGIGTTTPGALLVLGGNGSVTGTQQWSNFSSSIIGGTNFNTGSNVFQFGTLTSSNLMFMTGSTERVRIDTSGNVGIGTTNPTNKLEVAGNIVATTTVDARSDISSINTSNGTIAEAGLVLTNDAAKTADFNIFGSGNTQGALFGVARANNAFLFGESGSALIIGTRGAQTLTLGTNGNAAMTIDVSGNIGIGTTAPLARLDLGLQAPGINTPVQYQTAAAGNSNWTMSNSSIYDSTSVDQYQIFNGSLSGGTKAAPTFTGSPTGGYFIRNFTGAAFANSRLDLGYFSGTGAGQTGTSTLSIVGDKVGVGSTTPFAALSVTDTINSNIFSLQAGRSYNFQTTNDFGSGGTDLRLYGGDSNNKEYLYLSRTGTVGVGTTTSGFNSPKLLVAADPTLVSIPLQVSGDVGGRMARFYTNDFNNSSVGSSFRINFGAATGNTYTGLQAYTTGETVMGNLILNGAGGNVGIGVTNPGQLLQVGGTGGGTGGISMAGAQNAFFTGLTYPVLYTTKSAGGSTYPFLINDTLVLQGRANDSVDIAFVTGATPATRMVIQGTGNVGIGTTNPAYPLELQTNKSGDFISRFYNTNTTTGNGLYIRAGGSSAGTVALQIENNAGTSLMQVLANGNVGIGTTNPSTAKIVVNSDLQAFTAIDIKDTNATLNGAYMAFENSAGGSTGTITHNGTNSVAYNTTSDKRLKNDLGVASTTDVLKNIVIHNFTWKTDGSLDEGVFAQDAYLVKPNAVHVGSNNVDANGNLTNPWSVDYSKFVPDLLVGWQVHEGRLVTLESEASSTAQSLASLFASASSTTASIQGITSSLGLNLADASAGLTVNGVVMLSGGLKVDSIGSIGDIISMNSDVNFIGRPYFNNDTGGLAVVEAGSRKVDVSFNAPYIDAPVVNATVTLDASTTDAQVENVLANSAGYVVTGRTANGFSIELAKPAAERMTFSWTALAIKNMRIANSAGTVQPGAPVGNSSVDGGDASVGGTGTPPQYVIPPVTLNANGDPIGASSSTPVTTGSDTASSTDSSTASSTPPAITDSGTNGSDASTTVTQVSSDASSTAPQV